MNLQTSSSLANVCMAAQLRPAISPVSREREKERDGNKLEGKREAVCAATPRHATVDPSMTAYLQREAREREEGTRPGV